MDNLWIIYNSMHLIKSLQGPEEIPPPSTAPPPRAPASAASKTRDSAGTMGFTSTPRSGAGSRRLENPWKTGGKWGVPPWKCWKTMGFIMEMSILENGWKHLEHPLGFQPRKFWKHLEWQEMFNLTMETSGRRFSFCSTMDELKSTGLVLRENLTRKPWVWSCFNGGFP